MKRPVNKILIVILTGLLLTGCKKTYIISYEQEILFQYEYINNSLTTGHSGYFIDNKGNVLIYNNPEDWNYPDKNFVISKDNLLENLSRCTVSEKLIPAGELEKFARHIPYISSSKVSAIRNTGSDMGSHTYICYLYDKTFDVYKGYLIKMEGDNTCENLNFYSKKILSWMKDINEKIQSK